jgi:hypothetical protein
MVCLVAAVEVGVEACALAPANPVTANSHFAAEMAAREAPGCDLLVFGDSQAKCGVYPAVLETGLGTRAYNLAILASPPPASYFLLRRALDAGARPRAILVGYMTLSGNAVDHLPSLEGLAGMREAIDLAWNTGDARLFGRMTVAHIFPSVRGRYALRAQIMRLACTPNDPQRARVRDHLALWTAHRGAARMASAETSDGHIETDLRDKVYSRRWLVSAVYARYFRRFLDLAAAREIPVFWVLFPIIPEAQALRDRLELEVHHTRNVRTFQERYSNLCVIDARHAQYPHTAFIDSCHLNDVGALRLSTEIAAIVAERLRAASWRSQWIEAARFDATGGLRPPERVARGGGGR